MTPFEKRRIRADARAERTGMHRYNSDVPPGWDDRVDKLIDAILLVDENARFIQVKTKFGGFRCHGSFSPAARKLIEQAELDLRFICWYCGGLATDKFHYEPACKDHKTGFNPDWDGHGI